MTAADRFNLDSKIALVTGAGSGLGRQFAHVLAEAGASVILAARRREKLEETAESIADKGGDVSCVDLDVTESSSVQDCFAEIESSVGTLDILVNNAGIARQEFLVDMSEDNWDAVIDTNLKGVFLVGQRAAQAMIKAERPGSIVNIASILGLRVSKALGSYIAAKSAVVQMTKAMALEWAQFGIRVNAIAPGYFITEMNQEQFDAGAGEILVKRVPMRRIGELEDLAGPILLLASDAGGFMTGSTIEVDGGQLCNSL